MAIILGLTVLLFVVGAWSLRFFAQEGFTPLEYLVESWTEILTAIIAGLLVWLGGKSTGDDE